MFYKIISNKSIFIIFLVFTAAHAWLFNINYAEWGDSYRILRASEYIRQGTYPDDEKRAPFYSLLLALRPENVDQVTWGRVEMFGLSLLFFVIFYAYLRQLNLGERVEKLSLWMLAFNPVFLYWSIRLMADVPFALIVLITIYLYTKWQDDLSWWRAAILGIMLGLAVLTRFEGYILGFSLGAAMLYNHLTTKKSALIKKLMFVFFGFLLPALPWFLYRNPLDSSYFEEPAGRAYDLQMVYIYLVSLMFVFGFSYACFFFVRHYKKAKDLISKNVFVLTFVLAELALALLWPAAIPRLFVPVIPFLIIYMSYLIDKHFSLKDKFKFSDVLILAGLLVFYLFSQYVLKLQFLVLNKTHLAVVTLIQAVLIGTILTKKYKLFKVVLILSMMVWSFSTVYLHRDIFKAVVKANKYVIENIHGRVAYNDVSSVSDWYLNQKSNQDLVTGFYLNMDAKAGRSYQVLDDEEVDYIIITNEHNTDMEFSADERDYLEEIKEFRYTIRGEEFFTKILKFKTYE